MAATNKVADPVQPELVAAAEPAKENCLLSSTVGTVVGEKFVAVGIDGSDAAVGAALWAAAEAQRRGVAMCMVHAYAVALIGRAGPVASAGQHLAAVAKAKKLLAAAQAAVTTAYPGLTVRTVIKEQSPIEALRAASQTAVLTVVGSHGQHQLTEALLGSVAARLAGHAHGPVVVIRAGQDGAPSGGDGPVLVGVDGSADSDQGLAFAFEEAALRRVPLIVVRTWDAGALDGFLGVYPLVVDPAVIDEQERGLLVEQLAGWARKYPEVVIRPLVLRGRPAQVLLRCCADPDRNGRRPALVVVGSRGRSGLAEVLMGSTSRAMIAAASCGVAVVRPAY